MQEFQQLWSETEQRVEGDGMNLRLGRKRKNERERGCGRADWWVIRWVIRWPEGETTGDVTT